MTVDSQRKLHRANRAVEEAAVAVENLEKMFEDNKKRVFEVVNRRITRDARQMVQKNYESSGVETQSGKLINAIRGIEARLILGGSSPRIKISLPKGIVDYTKKNGGGNFYRAAGSVNYGSVKANGANKTDKRKIKKEALKKAKKDGTLDFSGFIKVGRESKKRQKIRGFLGASVTQPKAFWSLSSSQESALVRTAMEMFTTIVFRLR